MIYDRYYYSTLNSVEKKIYKQLYTGISKMDDEVVLSVSDYSKVAIDKICTYLLLDNPHIFYVDLTHISGKYNKFVAIVKLNYWYTKDEVKLLTQKVNAVLHKMACRIVGKTDYEKELSIHDLLVKNITYDDTAAENLPKYAPRSNSILGVLFYKTAVCEGISKVAKMLFNLMNIKCIVATGSANSDGVDCPHAWNIVKIDGKAYHLDITWDNNLSTPDDISYDYFNLTDRQISQNHSWTCSYPTHNIE